MLAAERGGGRGGQEKGGNKKDLCPPSRKFQTQRSQAVYSNRLGATQRQGLCL